MRNFSKPEIDLIASFSNTQLPNFIHGKFSNAFHMFWGCLHFTTSHLIAKVLVEQEQTQCKSGNFLRQHRCSHPKVRNFYPHAKQKDSPNVERTLTDSVSLIRESLHQCNFSENVEELILQSWRASIQVKYKAYLERWYRLCTEESINPFNPLRPLDLI